MIDFACREFNLKDIIKCSLGLARSDFAVFEFLLKHPGSHGTEAVASRLALDLSTVQRAMKKLHEKQLVRRMQKNLSGGGYVFEYQINDKKTIRKIIMGTVHNWTARVEQELETW
jgi:predicted transcriptional regulator